MTLTVASLHVYPIKSLGGFNVGEVLTTERGFEHDRRWMLVDDNRRFLTQREVPAMACLHCSPSGSGFRITDVRDGASFDLPWTIETGVRLNARVWGDQVDVLDAPTEASAWLKDRLDTNCTLVFMPDESRRPVDPNYATGITSLSDGYPYLILSQASLDDLNGRLALPVPMERFRPNIVVAGGTAFQEDAWRTIAIGDVRFALVKTCARCVIPNTDQRTGARGVEPLRTLADYRKRVTSEGAVRVEFGMNAMALGNGTIKTGEPVALR